MTAGRGIVHSQMPASFEEASSGFQLWLNLKSSEKMKQPKYQEYKSKEIPVFEKNGTKVKLICGKWQGHQGPIKYSTPSYYMDIAVPENGQFQILIPSQWNSIIYVYKGETKYKGQKSSLDVKQMNCCVLEKSDTQEIKHLIKSQQGAQFLLICGSPLNQPIAQYGPFVMNTQQQLVQAFKDYQLNQNGFQNANKWQSEIQFLAKGKKL